MAETGWSGFIWVKINFIESPHSPHQRPRGQRLRYGRGNWTVALFTFC